MNEREGVIKYRLKHQADDAAITTDISQINAWRNVLFRLELIGQSPEKYHGLGYGNISQRLQQDRQAFLISGTQTGHLPLLTTRHFAIVEKALPKQNALFSRGPSRPSSEALTHASIYLHAPKAQAVIHVHCPQIWRQTQALQIPHTAADVPYGSLEMAEAVEELFASGKLASLPIFSMLGHEDGIVAFGDSLSTAALTLLTQFANALAIEQASQAG
ncbi:class II aldolase/adducin family protein [Methylomonas rapida]|uniref:Class II aldolase/adducin family protein n=1 Tax=Methylomonas rapida TaxID=2963939 RepID=A0ABY7GPM4_9GAMM|nr:class II aldolase/adducin family protein [Methylomonas rapida]WAR46453.1 class II aldolase/adducin family protein [Methylomonas rapida]